MWANNTNKNVIKNKNKTFSKDIQILVIYVSNREDI